jgi:hypothetical protein
VKPIPLSALLADDLLLDQVGARLDTDDELGSLLLAVAHRADTPIPRGAPIRRRRSHRGLTVLAALGVAVSGATVAAAVELAPVSPDQAAGAPHLRGNLPRSLQALALPFFAGTPFQGRLALPFGGIPTGPFTAPLAAPLTAEGLPAVDLSSVYPMGDPIVGATTSEDLQDPAREKTQGKGTPNGGTTLTDPSESGTEQGNQDNESNDGNQGNQGNQGGEPAEAASQPTKTPTPTPTIATPATTNNGATGVASGQNNGHNGQGNGQGQDGSSGGTGTTGTGTTTGTTTDGTNTDDDDPASRVPEKRRGKIRVASQPPVTSVAPAATTSGATPSTAAATTTGTTTGSTATSPTGP